MAIKKRNDQFIQKTLHESEYILTSLLLNVIEIILILLLINTFIYLGLKNRTPLFISTSAIITILFLHYRSDLFFNSKNTSITVYSKPYSIRRQQIFTIEKTNNSNKRNRRKYEWINLVIPKQIGV